MVESSKPTKCDDYISLKEYLEQKIEAVEKLNQKTFEMNNLAIKKAEDAMNLRLESMNEFRASMKDQQSVFATKAEFHSHTSSNEIAIDDLKKQLGKIQTALEVTATKAGMPMVYIIGLGSVVSLVLGIINLMSKFQ